MTLLKIVELIDRLIRLLETINKSIAKHQAEQNLKKHIEAEKKASDATNSLEERAKALCEVEKSVNPTSDCDADSLHDSSKS